MRRSRAFVLTLVVALSLVAPNVFGKVCAPRKPVTCGAAGLSSPAATSTVPSAATKPATKALKSSSPARNQQAMICFYIGGRFICKAATTLA